MTKRDAIQFLLGFISVLIILAASWEPTRNTPRNFVVFGHSLK